MASNDKARTLAAISTGANLGEASRFLSAQNEKPPTPDSLFALPGDLEADGFNNVNGSSMERGPIGPLTPESCFDSDASLDGSFYESVLMEAMREVKRPPLVSRAKVEEEAAASPTEEALRGQVEALRATLAAEKAGTDARKEEARQSTRMQCTSA
jgi:hypothetical protein